MKPSRDPMAPPTIPPLPSERGAIVAAWRLLHRDNAYLRRTIHRLQRKLRRGGEPTPFSVVPTHAKLRHRPIILGLAPSVWARSHVAWDDPTGDQLAARLGLGGLMHLMACFKLRNLYSCPLQDLPLAHQSSAMKREALAKLVAEGTFRDRVVIVCGNEIRALAGLSCDRDFIGPVSQQLGGSSLVISMVEPEKSRRWHKPDGTRDAMQAAVLAMLAARLPSATPVADAMQLVAGGDVDSWRALGGGPPDAFSDLMQQEPREVWRVLAGLGLVSPPDLGPGAWFHLDNQRHELRLTGGNITITFDHVLRDSGGEYVHGALNAKDGKRAFECWSRKPHEVRTRCLDEAVRLGWEFPYAALDRRLAEMRDRSPLHMDETARKQVYGEARRSS